MTSFKVKKIVDGPDQWIITRNGDFVRIKDSEIRIDKKLEIIRQKLSSSGRFKGKTREQISKERYDKVLEEVDFDYNKLHDWFYDPKNQDKIEIIKKSELFLSDRNEMTKIMSGHCKYAINKKWRLRFLGNFNKQGLPNEDFALINEETGQVIYDLSHKIFTSLVWKQRLLQIPGWKVTKLKTQEHTATLIFLHGTYGAGSLDQMAEKFPGLKIIHPYSPTIQYDMWHSSRPAPGGQCQGWINITGDAWEIMESDVCPGNPPINYNQIDQSIHLDYSQLRRAANYINEFIEGEIIVEGIPPERIFVAGYSQGGLLTLAMALISKYKLGGFISLCGLLPCSDKLLKLIPNKNKNSPILIINNTKDPWIPFWTGKKTYEILKEQGYNIEFKTHPGLGHDWKDKDVEEFLEKTLAEKREEKGVQTKDNFAKRVIIVVGTIGGIVFLLFIIIKLSIWRTVKK